MPEKNKRHIRSLVSEYEEKMKTGGLFYMEAFDLLDIMDFYLKSGKTDEADACLALALRLHPADENVLLSKAYRLKEKGLWEEAGQLVRELSDQSARDVQLFYVEELLAGLCTVAAENHFLLLVRDSNGTEQEKWELYISYIELLLDYDLSLRALKWLKRMPVDKLPPLKEQYAGVTQKHYYELLSEAYFQLYQYKKAAQALEKAIDLDPYDAVSWEQLSDVQQAAGLFEETLDSCGYALAINSQAARALRNKAFAHAALKQFPELDECVRKLREIESLDYNFYYLIGSSLVGNESYAEAIDWLRQAVRLCPVSNSDYSRILADFVRVLTMQHHDEEALDAYLCYAMAGNCEVTTALIDSATNSLLHKDVRLGLDILNKCVQDVELTSEDVVRIVKLLVQFELYADAASLWRNLFPLAEGIKEVEPQINLAKIFIDG